MPQPLAPATSSKCLRPAPGSSGWCTAGPGGWGAAGAPAALSETSLHPPDQLPPLCPSSWRYSDLHRMINPCKTAANITGMVRPRASGPSQQQKPDPPAPYDLSTSADVPHPHWHLTIHPIFKITTQCKISLPFPSPPSGRAKKTNPQTSVEVSAVAVHVLERVHLAASVCVERAVAGEPAPWVAYEDGYYQNSFRHRGWMQPQNKNKGKWKVLSFEFIIFQTSVMFRISRHRESLGECHGDRHIAEGMDGLSGHKLCPITSAPWPHQLLPRPCGSLVQHLEACDK